MLLDPDAEICANVAKDTMKARRLLSEAVKDFRAGGNMTAPHRLRVFWVPQDFDADNETQRTLIAEMLMETVSRDILMNVVFGNLTAEDVRFFVRTGGKPGLHLAILHAVSTSPNECTLRDLSDSLGVSQGPNRERLLCLLGCGFLSQFGGGVTLTGATLKGRVFLDLCGELRRQTLSRQLTAEIQQIMRLLDMRYAPSAVAHSKDTLHLSGPLLTEVPEMVTGRLVATIEVAEENWGIDLNEIPHVVNSREGPEGPIGWNWGSAGSSLIQNLRTESDRHSQ
ncbi:hypothetical protein [Streptomyces niveus]|uniref:hypothetical protein n=1 Tax=Streptomyces niveus TaxID=193462 RepID=UPI00342A879A